MYRRKTFILLIMAAWLLFGFCSCGYAGNANLEKTDANGLELRVMSFNIRFGTAEDGENHWKNRQQMVFDVLRNHKSDVIGMQETLHFQIEEILTAVPGYGMVGVGREDGDKEGEYSAILYDRTRFDVNESDTFWLSDTPEVPGSITWGNACTRICTWARFVDKKSGSAFYVYNLHLDHISQPSREKSAALLIQRIGQRKHRDPFLVTGDFNVGEGNPVIRYLKGEITFDGNDNDVPANPIPVVDTFRVLYPDASGVGTFNEFEGKRDGEKIDYILAPSVTKVLEAQILHDNVDGRYPSDHFPVIARLILFKKSIR